MDKIEQRKLITKILNAATKIAAENRKGPANYIRINPEDAENFGIKKEIAGIQVYEDVSTSVNEIIVGRKESNFEESIKISI